MRQTLFVFNLISMAEMTAVGMDAEIYRHSQTLYGGFFNEVVIKL